MKQIFYNYYSKVFIFLIVMVPAILTAQVNMNKPGNTSSSMKFEEGNQPTVSSFFQEYRQAYQLSDDIQMETYKVSVDQIGTHHRYDQYYKGIQILHAQYVLHERDGSVWYANGQLVHNLDMDVNPTISEQSALASALSHINADVYMWDNETNEKWLKIEQNNPNASFYPQGSLKLTSGRYDLSVKNMRLVYRFDIYAEQPLSRNWVDVDAITGEIINTISRIQNGDVPGSGTSEYNGSVAMTVDEVSASSFRLRENTTRSAPIHTFDMQNSGNYGGAIDFSSADANGPWDAVGVSAHWGAEATYDYYFDNHGRNSLDDAGFPLLSYVHYGSNYNNAFWDGTRMTYGDGNGATFTPLVSLDIVGHELTHGVTNFTSNLVYASESGALNESFSDIFGNMVEFQEEGAPGVGTGSWRMGEDITLTGPGGIRNMANPNEFNDPDTYYGDFWVSVTTTPDNGGVHTNSGVQNFWFYLLATGGSGTNDKGFTYNVTGIGLDNAAAIAYHNNTSFLTPTSNYYSAREGALACAEAIFGAGSQELISTADAWDAVGVYEFDVPENDDCIDAIALSCNETVSGNTIKATFDADVPFCDFAHTANGVWYTIEGNGSEMTASMCGGPIWDARLTVYEGSCESLVCVGADDDGCGDYANVSTFTWPSTDGTTYYILVHGFANSIGPFELTLSSDAPVELSLDPSELIFEVSLNGSASDELTISNASSFCADDLNWVIYKNEATSSSAIQPGSIGISNIENHFSWYKTESEFSDQNSPDGNDLYSHDIIQLSGDNTYLPPSGPPILISGSGESAPTGSGSAFAPVMSPITITHSLSQDIDGITVACAYTGTGFTSENSFVRVFQLSEFGIYGDFDVTALEFGVRRAVSGSGSQPITVRLHNWKFDNTLEVLGEATYQVPDQEYTMISLPVSGTAPALSRLLVEIHSPDGLAESNGFWIAANDKGQSDPSYGFFPGCWGSAYSYDLATKGFPQVHWVMNVTGNAEVTCPWLNVSPDAGSTAAGESSDVTVSVDATGLDYGTYSCQLRVNNNSADNATAFIPVTLNVVCTPLLEAIADPILLWPPNHKYQSFDVSQLFVGFVDNCGSLTMDDVYILSVTSDEEEDAPGNGDGKTKNDMKIAADCKSVQLRKERQGNGNGRVYTITLAADNVNDGTTGTATCQVYVPHNNGGTAIDDGMAWEVTGDCNNKSAIAGDLISGDGYELNAYPNPFTGKTMISFTLEESNQTQIRVYNSLGKEVAIPYNGSAEAGQIYTIEFNGVNLPKGIYFYHLQSGNDINETRKLILLK